MKKKDARWKTRLFWGLVIMSSVVCLLNPSKTKTTEAIQSVATHIGTFEGSTTFTTSSRNGINPGLFIEVMDEKGNLTQYESEEGVITIPGTQEGAYVTQAKLLGKTKYIDQDSGEVLDTWEEGRNLALASSESPILMTTGKNLFNGFENETSIDGLYSKSNWGNANPFIINHQFKKGDVISLSFDINLESSNDGNWLMLENSTASFSERIVTTNDVNNKGWVTVAKTFTVNSDIDQLIFKIATAKMGYTVQVKNIQLEYDGQTSYIPYQSSSLSLSENMVLRSIPNEIYDVYDVMTKEYTQRIGEYTFDGSEKWSFAPTNGGDLCTYFQTNTLSGLFQTGNTPLHSDRFPWINRVITNTELIKVGTDEGNVFIYINILNSRLTEPTIEALKEWLAQNPVTIQYQLAAPTTKVVDLTSDYPFKVISIQKIEVNGTILPLIGSVTVPTEALSFVLDPNQAEDQQFVAPEFSLTNSNHSPLRVKLKSFEQTTDVLNDVLPTTHADWTQLNQQQSKDIALSLVPKPSDQWLSLIEGPRYVADGSNSVLGEIKANSTVTFTFNALHGRAFSEALSPRYRLTFVFDFN